MNNESEPCRIKNISLSITHSPQQEALIERITNEWLLDASKKGILVSSVCISRQAWYANMQGVDITIVYREPPSPKK